MKVSMIKCLNNVLHELPEYLGTSESFPAVGRIFKVISESKTNCLPKEQELVFHHAVAQFLFIPSRYRRDIQKAVSLLTTRVK